tara:strand:+ start:530 stop:778 length:249 start_codon:yes stop_codon:yes gene_type:complete
MPAAVSAEYREQVTRDCEALPEASRVCVLRRLGQRVWGERPPEGPEFLCIEDIPLDSPLLPWLRELVDGERMLAAAATPRSE